MIARSTGRRGVRVTQAVCDRAKLLRQSHDWNTVCTMLGISSSTLTLIKKRGWKPAPVPCRPIPHDFILVADGMNQVELMAHYGANGRTIARWRREMGLPNAKSGREAMPIPGDFIAQSARMSRAQLAVHYGVCVSTITTWRKKSKCRAQDIAPPARTIGWADSYFQVAA